MWLLCLTAGLQSACFGVIGTALPPALRSSGLSPREVAQLLGQLGSASALAEVLLSGGFGKLADAIGRKPILLAAPAITAIARSTVICSPTLPTLIAARVASTLAVPVYWLAYQALMADCFGHNATQLAVVGSRIQAAMGLGYAVSSLVGGPLAQRDIRYAYACSCTLGAAVLGCVAFGFRETLAEARRVRFAWRGSSPLSSLALFRRGLLSAKLNLVVVCQSLTNGMGDLWQVLARELRGWGAAQCGRYAAAAGFASMLGTLLTGPSIRRLGARGHTAASTGASACASLLLGRATSDPIAFGAIVPLALGAGKGQATSARITNLGERLGDPEPSAERALPPDSARTLLLGEELGVPQGQLAAERNTLNAVIKVIAPSLYAWLFAFGSARGVLGLPFYSTALLLCVSAAVALSIPEERWTNSSPQGAAREGGR